MADKNEFILFGVGTPYVYEIYESLLRGHCRIMAFIDNQNLGAGPHELGAVVNVADMQIDWTSLPVLFPLLTPGYRKSLINQATTLGFSRYPAHIDPTSVVASTTKIEAGVLVNASATIGAMSHIGRFSIINRSASVGHHVVLEEFVTLGPGCILCGSSVIGRGTFIGAGAIINPEINIGANCIVGAGAVVVRDIDANCVVVGNPARVIRQGSAGYNGVSV